MTVGSRGSTLLDDVEQASAKKSNDTLENGLNDATNTYVKFQKVICGRDLSSDDAITALFGGEVKSE